MAATELAGTWVFNDTINLIDGYFSLNYTSDYSSDEYIQMDIKSEPVPSVSYMRADASIIVYNSRGWVNEAYKTITITSKLSEVTNGDALLAWLHANATRQETDTSKKLTKLKYKASDVCQLFDKDKFFATRTAHGVVFTNNGDGSFTINGTCDADADADQPLFLPPVDYSVTFDLYSIENHKYLLIPLPQAFSYSTLRFIFGTGAVPYYETSNTYEIYTATKTGTYPCYAIYRVGSGTTINNLTIKPQLFDLTEMYGAGNEPTTLAEFRQKYPNDLYPYSPQCWYPINKTRYITPTKNLFNIGLSTNWQDPVNRSYGYVPIFIGVGKTCTISWDLDYYRKHPGTEDIYMCINTGEQPSTSNREWLYHQTIPSLQKSQLTVSANSTGYIYFELANGYNTNKEYLQKYLFNENLKWQLELGNQKTDYVPHGYISINKGVKL